MAGKHQVGSRQLLQLANGGQEILGIAPILRRQIGGIGAQFPPERTLPLGQGHNHVAPEKKTQAVALEGIANTAGSVSRSGDDTESGIGNFDRSAALELDINLRAVNWESSHVKSGAKGISGLAGAEHRDVALAGIDLGSGQL